MQTIKLTISTLIVTFNNFYLPFVLQLFWQFYNSPILSITSKQDRARVWGDRITVLFFLQKVPPAKNQESKQGIYNVCRKKEPLFASWESYWPLSGERDAKCGRRLITWKGRGLAWSDGGRRMVNNGEDEAPREWWWDTHTWAGCYQEVSLRGEVSERCTIQINMDASATFPLTFFLD